MLSGRFVQKLPDPHKWVLLTLGALFVVTYFAVPHFVYADVTSQAAEAVFIRFVTGIISIIISVVGGLLTIMIDALVRVALFNDFLGVTGVQLGWTVVRDVGNMILVMVFLVIAFGTVFKIQSLEYKNTLM